MQNPSNLLKTLESVLVSAASKIDDVADKPKAAFTFRLMAAATKHETKTLPSHWNDCSNQVSLNVSVIANNLRLTFQAEGFQAVAKLANSRAKLVTNDGTIRIDLHFDSAGTATVDLINADTTRQAIADFGIFANA